MGTRVLVHRTGVLSAHDTGTTSVTLSSRAALSGGPDPLLQYGRSSPFVSYTKMFIFSVRRHSKRLLKLSVPK